MLSALDLINLLGAGKDPAKPSVPPAAPADNTAVARNRGVNPSTREEAEARDAESKFHQARLNTYGPRFGQGEEAYGAHEVAEGSPGMYEPLAGFALNTPESRSIDSTFWDMRDKAHVADIKRDSADTRMRKILKAASQRTGQRKVAP